VDRVAEDLAAGTPNGLREDLIRVLGERKVLHSLSDLVRYATDASPYRFVPQVVVIAETVDDVAAVLRYARGHHRDIVFRAAGTSLNGQSQGNDILVDVRRHWTGVEVLDGGAHSDQARHDAGACQHHAGPSRSHHGTRSSELQRVHDRRRRSQ